MGGLIGELLEWLRTTDDDAEIAEARVDFGGDDTATAPDYQPSGHDSQPLPGDFAIVVPGPEAGSYVVVGWIDPNNAGVTKEGEVRLYSRSGGIDIVCSLRLTQDGELHLGEDTAAALIARADRTDAELEKIKTVLEEHIHVTTATEGSSATVGTLSPTTTKYSRADTGCDKVYGT